MGPHKAARTDQRGVGETRMEQRTADLPSVINVQRKRHMLQVRASGGSKLSHGLATKFTLLLILVNIYAVFRHHLHE